MLGNAFMGSKVFLSAIELDLFTLLYRAPDALSASEICDALSLHSRACPGFLDTLVALSCLQRDGTGSAARYRNTETTDRFFVKDRESFLGGFLEMHSKRTFAFWAHFTDALKTGLCQNEGNPRNGSQEVWEAMYHHDANLRTFVNAMKGLNMPAHAEFARLLASGGLEGSKEDQEMTSAADNVVVLDIGGASGQLCCEVAKANPESQCYTMDLEKVCVLARENITKQQLEDRVVVCEGDMWVDKFDKWCQPDVIVMGMILHDYGLEGKKKLIRKAFEALADGGRLVTIEMLIDEDRTQVDGLVMSMLMLIETEAGFDYTAKEWGSWVEEAGFQSWREVMLHGPIRSAVAYKGTAP